MVLNNDSVGILLPFLRINWHSRQHESDGSTNWNGVPCHARKYSECLPALYWASFLSLCSPRRLGEFRGFGIAS